MPTVIPRSEWGARHPNGGGSAPVPFSEWWLHHSVTIAPDLVPPFDDEYRAMRVLEDIGQQRFGQGISYTFPIMPSGRIYEGHSINRLGAHTGGRNSIARAICFVGNYETSRPTDAQIESAAQLMVAELRAGRARRATLNGGHRDLKATACPGRFGYETIRTINARALQILQGGDSPAPTPPPAPPHRQAPGRFAWRLPPGHYYGHKDGPAQSHGGYYASERDEVRNIQQWLIYHGCVPGVGDWQTSGWDDGLWEDATSRAMRTWHDRFYRNQPQPEQCWSDDYDRLARE